MEKLEISSEEEKQSNILFLWKFPLALSEVSYEAPFTKNGKGESQKSWSWDGRTMREKKKTQATYPNENIKCLITESIA